jgi:hypothetical protein
MTLKFLSLHGALNIHYISRPRVRLHTKRVSGQDLRNRRFTSMLSAPSTHYVWSKWVPTAGLDSLEKKGFLPLSEIKPRFLGSKVLSLVTTPEELFCFSLYRARTPTITRDVWSLLHQSFLQLKNKLPFSLRPTQSGNKYLIVGGSWWTQIPTSSLCFLCSVHPKSQFSFQNYIDFF